MSLDVPSRQLRPLSVGEIVDVAIKLYLRNWRTLLSIVAFVVVPVEVLSFLLQISTVPDGTVVDDGRLVTATGDDANVSFAVTALSTGVLSSLATLLATGALFRALAEAYLGRVPDRGASLRFALARLAPLLWLTVLLVLGLVLAFLCLVVPGIWLAVAWSVAVPALMIEDARGGRALRRSFDLVRGRWWPTFGALLLLLLIAFLLSGALGGGIAAVILSGSPSVTTYFALNSLANLLATLVTTPLQAAIIAVVYFDLRVRKEGFDLERLAARLERPDAGDRVAPVAPAGWEPPSAGR